MKEFLAIYLGAMHSQKFQDWMARNEKSGRALEREGMIAWHAWQEAHRDVIVVEGGPLGKTKSVDERGVSDVKNLMSGYVVVRAETHEDAARMFENHPHFAIFPGEKVEIMECMPIPSLP